MTWTVRKAAPPDASAIARINVDGWRVAYADIVPAEALESLDVDSFADSYREILAADDPIAVFVATDGGRIVAFCGVCPVRNGERDAHSSQPTGELAAIYVAPAMRGAGAGHAVHDAGLAHLAAAGFEHAVLWVFEANQLARSFYARHGWVLDSAHEYYETHGQAIPQVRYSRCPKTSTNG